MTDERRKEARKPTCRGSSPVHLEVSLLLLEHLDNEILLDHLLSQHQFNSIRVQEKKRDIHKKEKEGDLGR
jgi:hypothetical protein